MNQFCPGSLHRDFWCLRGRDPENIITRRRFTDVFDSELIIRGDKTNGTGADPVGLSIHRDFDRAFLDRDDFFLRLPFRRMDALAGIEHVKIVRLHTRVPVVEPARITAELVRALKADGKATYVVLHANHPRELTEHARAACARA